MSDPSLAPVMTANNYGKQTVRVTKVKRGAHVHEVMQFTVRVALSGDFAAAYTHGDNRLVIATDTIKNTVYIVASEHHCNDAETFAVDLARHFVRQYAHVDGAVIELEQELYDRIPVGNNNNKNVVGHPTAFVHRGPEKHWVQAEVRRNWQRPRLMSGIVGLQVLRTAGSEWADFHRDEYRALGDTKDRLMATVVDARWVWNDSLSAPFNETYETVRRNICETFCNHHSLGVQATMFKIAETVLKRNKFVETIRMTLPNVHHIPFDLSKFGRTNRNEIFVATSEPAGNIHIEMSRARSSKL